MRLAECRRDLKQKSSRTSLNAARRHFSPRLGEHRNPRPALRAVLESLLMRPLGAREPVVLAECSACSREGFHGPRDASRTGRMSAASGVAGPYILRTLMRLCGELHDARHAGRRASLSPFSNAPQRSHPCRAPQATVSALRDATALHQLLQTLSRRWVPAWPAPADWSSPSPRVARRRNCLPHRVRLLGQLNA